MATTQIPHLPTQTKPRYTFRARNPADHNARICAFLTELPAEVRIRIYKHLLASASLFFHTCGDVPEAPLAAPSGNIIFASRQCYTEAVPVFYQLAIIKHCHLDWSKMKINEHMKKHTRVMEPCWHATCALGGYQQFANLQVLEMSDSWMISRLIIAELANPANLQDAIDGILQSYQADLTRLYAHKIRRLGEKLPHVALVILKEVRIRQRRHGLDLVYEFNLKYRTVRKREELHVLCTSQPARLDRDCNICRMWNLMWMMCSLRIRVLQRRRRRLQISV